VHHTGSSVFFFCRVVSNGRRADENARGARTHCQLSRGRARPVPAARDERRIPVTCDDHEHDGRRAHDGRAMRTNTVRRACGPAASWPSPHLAYHTTTRSPSPKSSIVNALGISHVRRDRPHCSCTTLACWGCRRATPKPHASQWPLLPSCLLKPSLSGTACRQRWRLTSSAATSAGTLHAHRLARARCLRA
jgi:hypothetical protein